MGCGSSSQKAASENSWQDLHKPRAEHINDNHSKPQAAGKKSSPPASKRGLHIDVGGGAFSSDGHGGQSSSPLPTVGGAPGRKKLTLLQTRSLSVQTHEDSPVCGQHHTPALSSPWLDPDMQVVVPDDFRKKYKILSCVTEKHISSFAFHASAFCADNEDVTSGDDSVDNADLDLDFEGKEEDCRESHRKGEAAVAVYKGIDRQKKYVIVERTRTDVFRKKSTMQIEFFDRMDRLRSLDHPCLPTILDVFDTPQDYTVVFQYGVGKSLAELMEQRGAVTRPEALRAMVLALVDTLKHMHKQNIAHRNISADHMIVSRYNHFERHRDLKVTGLSRLVLITATPLDQPPPPPQGGQLPSLSTSPTGSPNHSPVTASAVPARFLDVFSAPELSQPGHGLSVDLYSLGVVLYSLVAGTVPASHSDIDILSLNCPSKLKRVIKAQLQTDPSLRFSLRKVEHYFLHTFLSDHERSRRGDRDLSWGADDIHRNRSNSSCSDVDGGGFLRLSHSGNEEDEDKGKEEGQLSLCSSIASSSSSASSSASKPDTAPGATAKHQQQRERSQKLLECDHLSDC